MCTKSLAHGISNIKTDMKKIITHENKSENEKNKIKYKAWKWPEVAATADAFTFHFTEKMKCVFSL